MLRFRRLASIVIVGFLVSACGEEEAATLEEQPPDEIYRAAERELNDNDNVEAARLFGEVERLYPYSEWAKRSVIMSAYAFHRSRQYDSSRAAAQRYLDFYPADEDAAYAQYLIALSHYDQIDDVSRDQAVTMDAMRELRTVVEFYPNSEYAASSRLKLDLALDHLAGKEMEIGRFYLKRGHYGAAVKRFRVVLEEYQTTRHTPEALHRLVEAYLSLGLDDDAMTAGAILGHNFRGSEWYSDSYALLTSNDLDAGTAGQDTGGWLREVYRQVVRGEWL